MRRLTPHASILAALLLLVLSGCQLTRTQVAPRADASAQEDLTLIAAELELHLRDDTYRYGRPIAPDGRNVFASSLWRLDRLQRSRARPPERWESADVVIEFARARALERLRRYADALEAYQRASSAGTSLAEIASEFGEVLALFALHSGQAPHAFASPEEEGEFLEERVSRWRDLSWKFRNTTYESLALEELEAWEMLRLEWLVDTRGSASAIAACERLIERHHASKLYARHLIRLGDLHADGVRGAFLRYRAHRVGFDVEAYQRALDQALAAYELARAERRPPSVTLAEQKIGELLMVHEAVYADAP